MKLLLFIITSIAAFSQAPAAGDCTLSNTGTRVTVSTTTAPDVTYDCTGGTWVIRGGVVGPLASIDNGLTTFDGTTGKVIKNPSGWTAAMYPVNGGSTAYMNFDRLGVNPSHGELGAGENRVYIDAVTDGDYVAGVPFELSAQSLKLLIGHDSFAQVWQVTEDGLLELYNQAPSGNSKSVVRAGAAQSTSLFETQSNDGTPKFSVTASGAPKLVSIAEPTCDATSRGTVTAVFGGVGVADTLRICRKDAANSYAWTALY